jgi:hypothetical protein
MFAHHVDAVDQLVDARQHDKTFAGQQVLQQLRGGFVVIAEPKRLPLQRNQNAQRFAQILHGFGAAGQADNFVIEIVKPVLAAHVLGAQHLAELFEQLDILVAGLQVQLIEQPHHDAARALNIPPMRQPNDRDRTRIRLDNVALGKGGYARNLGRNHGLRNHRVGLRFDLLGEVARDIELLKMLENGGVRDGLPGRSLVFGGELARARQPCSMRS